MKRRLRVLNVDDDDAGRYVKNRMLRLEGHEVLDAATGAEALLLLASMQPDLALIDMKLPDMSGFELTRRIRADAATGSMPIIQTSAVCVTDDDEIDGLDSGADAYLIAPIQQDRLSEIVRYVSRGRTPPEEARDNEANRAVRNRIQKVEAYIRANLANRLSIAELAATAGHSPFHFARTFKAATGKSPHRYVTQARVEAAKSLLARTDFALRVIAEKVGFGSQSHFSAVFHREAGMPPLQYRREANGESSTSRTTRTNA